MALNKFTSTIRRTVAAALLSAGLAYPACAAVCPKGIGGCTAPGRCFLFTDADANSLCDYTARSGAQGSYPSAPVAPAGTTVPSTPVTTPDTAARITATPTPGVTGNTSAVVHPVSGSGFFDSLPLSAPVAGLALFLVMTGVIFLLVRHGIAGVRIEKSRPALALAAFFGMGISLIATSALYGSALSGTSCALIYMGAGTPLLAYLWQSGTMNRKITLGAALLSTLAGFVFLAPIMPLELGGFVNVLTGTSSLNGGIIVIGAVILLALVTGRVFCGNLCPVGSLQELAYQAPVQKVLTGISRVPELVRLAVFAVTAIAAVYLIDLMAYTGLYDLFSLTLSAGFVAAAALVLASAFVYRPVCRFLCPFGVLFSLPAEYSLFRLRRSRACVGCRKCEKACPTATAGAYDAKRECYLCGRCTDACPVPGALAFRRSSPVSRGVPDPAGQEAKG